MKQLNVGLVKGRHDLPVDAYIFDKVNDVLDFKAIQKVANDFVVTHCGIRKSYAVGINQSELSDVKCFTGSVELHVYVTGLTACVASVISACAYNGVKLVLHHYDSSTGDYVEQVIF